MEILKIGVMGARRGSSFMRTLQYMEEAKVVAICEVDDAALEENEYVTDEMKIYRDYDEFVHSGLDAVILCNFFHEHAPYAIKAFEAGVAVLSETTAAASLGECVQLVEKCEEHQGTYILLANCPYFTAVHAMKKRIDEGKMGRVLYGEAEYLHYTHVEDGSKIKKDTDLNNLHWRQVLPSNMYNMHTLGTLMYVTGSVPMKVSCKMIRRTDFYKSPRKLTDCNGSVVITEMSNGAVFNTTGCSGYAPTSKWYRLACEQGTMETKRYDKREDKLIVAGLDGNSEEMSPSLEEAGLVKEGDGFNLSAYEKSSHGGIDYHLTRAFIRVLLKKEKPFLDVYRSAALSAAGILGWYSALSDGKELRIPDFTKKEERDAVRDDFRTPFAKRYSDLQMPCRLDEKDKFVL